MVFDPCSPPPSVAEYPHLKATMMKPMMNKKATMKPMIKKEIGMAMMPTKIKNKNGVAMKPKPCRRYTPIWAMHFLC